MVISLERGANDLHVVQLMPLPPHHLFSKIEDGLPFWCRLTQVVLDKRPLNGCSIRSLSGRWPNRSKRPGGVAVDVHTRDGTGSGFLTPDPTRPGGFWPGDPTQPDLVVERCKTNPRQRLDSSIS